MRDEKALLWRHVSIGLVRDIVKRVAVESEVLLNRSLNVCAFFLSSTGGSDVSSDGESTSKEAVDLPTPSFHIAPRRPSP